MAGCLYEDVLGGAWNELAAALRDFPFALYLHDSWRLWKGQSPGDDGPSPHRDPPG